MSTDIVVGIDDSASARAALTWAAAHARSTGARLRAIHVLDASEARELYAVPVFSSRVFPSDVELDPAWTAPARRVFAAADPDPSWTLQLGQGHPGQVMVDASRDAAMLVLGTREHVGLGRLVNGSVSHYGVNHATCPVVVVPLERADPSGAGGPATAQHAEAAAV